MPLSDRDRSEAHRTRSWLSHPTRSVAAMFFDEGCLLCQDLPGPVCASCVRQLQPGAQHWRPHRVAVELDEAALQLVAALKYRRQRRIVSFMAERIAEITPIAADVLTWIPAAPHRVRQRGFDQAREIARQVGALTGVPVCRLLARARGDAQQTGQTSAGRASGPDLVALCQTAGLIAVVDDVVTTGSSMRVAVRTLERAGARRVVGVAFGGRSLSGSPTPH